MSAYGTDQSKLYQLRGGAETEHRDRSMEQSNSNSGNPYGYIPPTFNPNTSTWNIPMNYTVPTPQGVGLPEGPGQYQPFQIRPLAPQFPSSGNPSPPAQPGGGNVPTSGPSTPPFPVTGPVGGPPPLTGGTPQPPTISPPSQPPYMPRFNDGSTASELAKHFLPGVGDNTNSQVLQQMNNYLQPGQTSYAPSPYAGTQPVQPVLPDIMDNSGLAQHMRYLKGTGFRPPHTIDARAGKKGGGTQ